MADFKESEHPRDKDGKFTIKGNGQGWTKEKKDRLLKALRQFERKTKLKISLQFFAEEAIKTQTNREIKKGIRNLNKRIAEHQEKIANPQKWYTQWETFTDTRKQNEINHWKNEIDTFREAIKNREDEIEKRGNNGT